MWVTDFDKRSWRSILKWGDPGAFKHPDKAMLGFIRETFGIAGPEEEKPHLPGLDVVRLDAPCRLTDAQLAELRGIVGAENVSTDGYDRVLHAYGKAYEDIVRLRRQEAEDPPDVVVYPRTEAEAAAVVNFCHGAGIALVPAGGRSSVTKGIAFPQGGVCLDVTRHLNQVLEIDRASRLARVQPGMYGPAYEKRLNAEKCREAPHGFTCGHFPQSFEFSTVGGWIAARGAGQQSTGYGRIDDLVLGQKWATPAGMLEIQPYPASAIGPDLNRLALGSEGTFGVITEATLRIFKNDPAARQFFSFMFRSWDDAINASREILQGGFGRPSMLRISDPEETWVGLKLHKLEGTPIDAAITALGYKPMQRCLMIGSTEGDVDAGRLIKRKIKKIARAAGGFSLGEKAAKSWWKGRYADPYMREDLMDIGIMADTLETAVTWSKLKAVWLAGHDVVKARERTVCMVHASHFYDTGANLYFIILSTLKKGDEIDDFVQYQRRIVDAIRAAGGSISHHHNVGRLFAPWMREQVGKVGLEALRGVKNALDPRGVMNPGGMLGLDGEAGGS